MSSTTPQKLQLLEFKGKLNQPHWGVFLSEAEGKPIGLLIHVDPENKSQSGTVEDALKPMRSHITIIPQYPLVKSSVQQVKTVPGAMITARQLEDASNVVFRRKPYNMITNNCQHFVANVIVELNNRHPQAVTQRALDFLKQNGTLFTKTKALVTPSKKK